MVLTILPTAIDGRRAIGTGGRVDCEGSIDVTPEVSVTPTETSFNSVSYTHLRAHETL